LPNFGNFLKKCLAKYKSNHNQGIDWALFNPWQAADLGVLFGHKPPSKLAFLLDCYTR
jgi:hypothetical protein